MTDTTEEVPPLTRKIDSPAALRAALKEWNKTPEHRRAYRDMYRSMRRSGFFGAITDDSFHLWRDELRFRAVYWVSVKPQMGHDVEQDKFLHLSLHNGGVFVAFAENEEKQKRDVFTRMRYGKYLAKYHPELNNEQVKQLVADLEYKHGEPPGVKFGEAEEDFVRAIKGGPSDSCQADSFYTSGGFNFTGHAHPAVCYASGDIQVAWIEDSDGKVTARTLVNKSTKRHSRTYGDMQKLDAQLEALGYEKRSGALVGCRLLRIDNENGSGWLMPYVDAGAESGGGSLYASTEGDYWVLNDEGNGVNTYCGYDRRGVTTSEEEEEEEPEYGHCDHCGDGLFNCSDVVYSEYLQLTYCTSCADEHWTYAIVGTRGGGCVSDYVQDRDCTYIDCLGEHARDSIIGELDIVYDSGREKYIELDDAVVCVSDDEYHHCDDCVEAGAMDGGIAYLRREDLDDSRYADRIYYNAEGEPFWYGSDEIKEWISAGDELDKYTLRVMEEVGQTVSVSVPGPRWEETPPPAGAWREIYQRMQQRGVMFDYRAMAGGAWFDGGVAYCAFFEGTPRDRYRIRPEQPEPHGWKETFLEAQRRGVAFDMYTEGNWRSYPGALSFTAAMSSYRISEVKEEVIV